MHPTAIYHRGCRYISSRKTSSTVQGPPKSRPSSSTARRPAVALPTSTSWDNHISRGTSGTDGGLLEEFLADPSRCTSQKQLAQVASAAAAVAAAAAAAAATAAPRKLARQGQPSPGATLIPVEGHLDGYPYSFHQQPAGVLYYGLDQRQEKAAWTIGRYEAPSPPLAQERKTFFSSSAGLASRPQSARPGAPQAFSHTR